MTVPKGGTLNKSARVTVSASSIPSASMIQVPSRTLLKTILKTFLKIIFKLWKWASSFVLVFFFAAWFYGGLLPYLIFVAAFLSLSYHITDYFLYQPDMPSDSRLFVESPARYAMQFEDVWIQTKDRVKIHGYLIKQNRLTNRNIPTIVFFHGNAGNIGHRMENVKQFYYHVSCNVLMVEYRGYGRSEGVPSEKGLYADAQAAFEFLETRDDIDSKKIILFGRSLGGAVAIDLAARCDFRDRIAALIVENTFTGIPSLARELFKFAFVKWVPTVFYKNRFESLQKIGSVACPTLFISGTNDELLPPAMMNDLYSKCSANVKLLQRFPGSHNDTWCCKEYVPRITEFIEEVVINGPKNCSSKYQPYSDNIV